MRKNNKKRGPSKPKPKKLGKGIKIRNALHRKWFKEVVTLLEMQSICPKLISSGSPYEVLTKFFNDDKNKQILKTRLVPEYYPITQEIKDFKISPEQKQQIMKVLEQQIMKAFD